MSTKDRKARKRAGEKYQPKPAKVPTHPYVPTGEPGRQRRAGRELIQGMIRDAAAKLRKEEGLD